MVLSKNLHFWKRLTYGFASLIYLDLLLLFDLLSAEPFLVIGVVGLTTFSLVA